MDLLGGLPDQEQTAGNQDQVPPGETVSEGCEERLRELDDDRDGSKQAQAENKGEADAACWSGSR
jgi:hypothetical protein